MPVGFTPLREGAGDIGIGERALDREAAVGLLSLSAALALRVAFLTGVGFASGALRALASDAAVGANKWDGVLGRDVVEGVLGLVGVWTFEGPKLAREGVFGREGVLTDAFATDRRAVVDVVD